MTNTKQKDFVCWLSPCPESSRIVTMAANRKQAIDNFAKHLGVSPSGYLHCRARKEKELNTYKVRI